MVILRYTTNGLAFRRVFHDDSWKVKLRTLLEAGIEVFFVEEKGLTRSAAKRRPRATSSNPTRVRAGRAPATL